MTQKQLNEFGHVPRKVGPAVQARIDALQIGQRMQDLPEELWHDSFRYYVKEDPDRKGGPNLRLIRLDPAMPSLTVTAYIYNKFVHPWEDRYITPREAARLQDFPDDFIFEGSLTSVQRQIGNAVPVRLAAAVAKQVLSHAAKHGTLKRYIDNDPKHVPLLSLFSGVGALDLGFGREMARAPNVRFEAVAHVEFDDDCCRTLTRNFREQVVPTDICSIDSPTAFVKQHTGRDTVPIIIGGPPCQAFSQAGRQEADKDARGQLIFEFLRFVEEIRPTYFVMENVSNLKGVGGGSLFASVLSMMQELGYHVSPHKLCAAHYGTPQLRWRWFFLGVRHPYPPMTEPEQTHQELDDTPHLLHALPPFCTVGDAFQGLPKLLPSASRKRRSTVDFASPGIVLP